MQNVSDMDMFKKVSDYDKKYVVAFHFYININFWVHKNYICLDFLIFFTSFINCGKTNILLKRVGSFNNL